jgi:Holliday junction resolvasome RuvABC endonuclease subunit
LIESGKVKFNGQFIFRIIELKNWMVEKIKEYEYDEVEVVLEEIQEQSNAQTFKKLAMLQGVLLVALEEIKIKYHLVYSSQWKNRINIKETDRASQKKAAQAYVLEKYNKSVSQDEADAICIGEYISNGVENWGP